MIEDFNKHQSIEVNDATQTEMWHILYALS